MVASCGSLSPLTPRAGGSSTTLISQIWIYHAALVAGGTSEARQLETKVKKKKKRSVLSLSRNTTLQVSHRTTFVLRSVQIHKSHPHVYKPLLTIYTSAEAKGKHKVSSFLWWQVMNHTNHFLNKLFFPSIIRYNKKPQNAYVLRRRSNTMEFHAWIWFSPVISCLSL